MTEDLKGSLKKVCKLSGKWLPDSNPAPIKKENAKILAELGLIRKFTKGSVAYSSLEIFRDFDHA